MNERFLREGMLLGEPALNLLAAKHVAVVGLGGVGSWCAESLARAGIGELTLIDNDSYSLSNMNRQLGATEKSIGVPKAEAMKSRVQEINPEIKVHAITSLYRPELIENVDYVADCIDMVSAKLDLIQTCKEKKIPIISSMGTGNKKNASLLEITDISKTMNDSLARVMRKELRTRDIKHLTVVYSPEEPMEAEQVEAPQPGKRSVIGSLVWVTASAGLLLTQHIVMSLIGENGEGKQ